MRERLIGGVSNGMVAGALWGLVFLAPQLLHDFSPLQLSVSRYLGYGLVAACVLAPRWSRLRGKLGSAEWWALVRLSLLGNLIYYVLLGAAVQWAGVAATSLIIGLLPVVVTVIGTRAAGAVTLSRLAAPSALGVLGVALVAFEALRGGNQETGSLATRAAGLACAFGALVSWSAYSIINARWLSRRPDLSGGDWSLLTGIVTGALALLLAAPAFALDRIEHLPADWARFWGIGLLLAIFASVVGNACWNRASRLLPLTLVGQMIVFETVFALLYGFLWEWRLPTLLESLAIACLIGGVIWCASAHVERRRAHPTAS
jgi:drug/metabolite transporter (DMT)-like permease